MAGAPRTATPDAARFHTLDLLRGVAVLGILAMNIVSFAMPTAAAENPLAYGMSGSVDLWSWLISFVLIDGKMRGLFSLLFGAGILLVVQQAEARGESDGAIHYRRMAWLLGFGLAHFYLIWSGDILVSYALCGMLAWFFTRLSVPMLLLWAGGLFAIQFLLLLGVALWADQLQALAGQPGADAETLSTWRGFERDFGQPSAAQIQQELTRYRGSYADLLAYRTGPIADQPVSGLLAYGWETLAFMLLGMAAHKSGFLTAGWRRASYVRAASAGLGVGITAYALFAWLQMRAGFDIVGVIAWGLTAPVLARPVMVVGLVALVILLGRSGMLGDRVAAAGRAAFTNYLGSSIVMTALFYGFGLGLFGRFGRAELWLFVLAGWALMLAWSKPWLDRHRHGPLEWLWRRLARGAKPRV